MKCPTCNGDCILPAQKVLDELLEIYMACNACPPELNLNKSSPVKEINSNSGRCKKCGKRHLDFVMGNVLTILKRNGLFPGDASLKEVGTPLIAFGFQIPYPPRLGNKSLVLIMDSITKQIADEIISEVPEVKGVIKRTGSQAKSIGILDIESKPHTYELLAGCDMRCDIVSSMFGELCIYKNQSKIHIEFKNTKIKKIEGLYLRGDLNNACVVDAFAGPGTLGLLSVLGGARKVILNDAWLPAVKNAILNIKANADILGVKICCEKEQSKIIGDTPVLLAKAEGNAEILIYHGDARKLESVVQECDVCLIDTFPSIDTGEFVTICSEIAEKVVVI